jgi:hypothetical protein
MTFASPAAATEFPPFIASMSGELWDARIDGGPGRSSTDDDPLTEWRQGGQVLGPYTSHRFVEPKTFADAGTITTCCGVGDFRDLSDRVSSGRASRRWRSNASRHRRPAGQVLRVVSRARMGGYGCGPIDRVGRDRTASGLYRGFDRTVRHNGRRVIVRNVYRMRRDSGSCRVGDTGAPVFRLTGTAMGIAFARSSNGQRCFFAQQTWVEYELNVRTFTGD